ncbi:MAG: hypothetical protein JNM24_03700 [Bdellovibrionaceae bacterium]|nr:hypothetical protein [Pseudobdellovibrionaceae bacterium]
MIDHQTQINYFLLGNALKDKMMNILFSILFVFMTAISSFAEPKAYYKEKDFFFQFPAVVIDGQLYQQKFWSGRFEVAEAMKSNPAAYKLAKDYESYMNKKSLFLWGGFAAALTYMISSGDAYNSAIYWGLFGTGFGIAMYQQYQGNKALSKSFTLYNKTF